MYIGITAEWNPFHNGHYYMINKIKEQFPDTPIIAIMSGSFVQRGEPALFDKWTRAQWAIQHGIDAVIELPVLCTIQSADKFAEAAVFLLHSLGCTHIAFGTESFSISNLEKIVQWTLNPCFDELFHQFLDEGNTYSISIDKAISIKFPQWDKELTKPNNLLGLRYIQTARKNNWPLSFISIKRDKNHPASATIARQELCTKGSYELLPPNITNDITTLIQEGHIISYHRYEDACLLSSRIFTKSDLKRSCLFSEGLENRWYDKLQKDSWPNILHDIKNKRYLYSRLKRISAALLIAGTRAPSPFSQLHLPGYARLLALRQESSYILKKAQIPIITRLAKDYKDLNETNQLMLDLDVRATDIQCYCFKNNIFRQSRIDFYHSPLLIK